MGACEWLTETKLNLRNSWRWLENEGQCQRIGEFPIILCRIGDKDLIARRLPFTWQISTTNSASLICKPHWLVDLHWEFIRYLQTLKIDYFPTLNIVRFCMVSLGTLLQAPTSISWQATESKHSPAPPIKSRYLNPPRFLWFTFLNKQTGTWTWISPFLEARPAPPSGRRMICPNRHLAISKSWTITR